MQNLMFNINQDILEIALNGDFLHFSANPGVYEAANEKRVKNIVVDGQNIKKWDSSLLLILFELSRIAQKRRISLKTKSLPDGLNRMLNLALAVKPHTDVIRPEKSGFLERLGGNGWEIYQTIIKGLSFVSESFGSLLHFFKGDAVMRKVDFLFALEDCGPKAVGIVSLISFMVGLILAFVGAIQLKTFGAQIYVASLVTIGMTRIMGAIMVGVIMAGRTGASFAATLGTMQVNEEIDALKTMGIPTTDFLILPRLSALVLAMPFLTILADFAGILGGGFVGIVLLDIPAGEYWKYAWDAWSMTNFWVGVFHGFVFGFIIALCGCYYGVNSGRNADGVGVATTKAVVSSIVWMIVATGIITVIFERLGL